MVKLLEGVMFVEVEDVVVEGFDFGEILGC